MAWRFSPHVLATDAISQCPDARKILRHLDTHFGIKVVGHPGITRVEQIEALVPYLDYLEPLVIHALWDLCNDRGWFNFRRAHLDAPLEGQWRRGTFLDRSQIFSELDADVEKNMGAWVAFWFDRYVTQDVRVEDIFQLLRQWLNERRTLSALKLVASAIVHAGKRRDVDLLSSHGVEPVEEAEAIIADTRFAVSQRSLT